MVITMASYALQTPPRVAHAKPPGPILPGIDPNPRVLSLSFTANHKAGIVGQRKGERHRPHVEFASIQIIEAN